MEYNEEIEYTIVGSTEVDLSQNKISNESPIGSALLGAKKNQIVEAKTPGGALKFKVLSIKKQIILTFYVDKPSKKWYNCIVEYKNSILKYKGNE